MLVVEDLPRLDIADLKALPVWSEIKANGETTVHLQNGDAVVAVKLSFLTDETPC